MTAYWVARSKVNDPEGYKRYTDLVPDILKKYGGKALSRGGDYKINEGPEYFNRFILIEFPSMDCLLYTSPSPRDGLLSRMPSSA